MKERVSSDAEGLIGRIINRLATCVIFCGIRQPPHAAEKIAGRAAPHATAMRPNTITRSRSPTIQQQPALRMQHAEPMSEGPEYNEILGRYRCRDEACHAPHKERPCYYHTMRHHAVPWDRHYPQAPAAHRRHSSDSAWPSIPIGCQRYPALHTPIDQPALNQPIAVVVHHSNCRRYAPA